MSMSGRSEFSDKVVVVTGASGGIGAAVAKRFRSDGALCVRLDVRTNGPNSYEIDVTSEASVVDVITGIAKTYKGIDVLVNCAGITEDGWMLRMSADDYLKVIMVNQFGTFLCMREVGKIMKAQGRQRGGAIVNLSSISAAGNPGQANYSASKAAVESMTQAAAGELGQFGIRVNAIAPGPVNTRMIETVPDATMASYIERTPLGEVQQPDDIANAAAFLASSQASRITGEVLTVSGGLHFG